MRREASGRRRRSSGLERLQPVASASALAFSLYVSSGAGVAAAEETIAVEESEPTVGRCEAVPRCQLAMDLLEGGDSPTAAAIYDAAWGVRVEVVPTADMIGSVAAYYIGDRRGGRIKVREDLVQNLATFDTAELLLHELTHAVDDRRETQRRAEESEAARLQRQEDLRAYRMEANRQPPSSPPLPDPRNLGVIDTEENAFLQQRALGDELEVFCPPAEPSLDGCGAIERAELRELLVSSDHYGYLFTTRFPLEAPVDIPPATPTYERPLYGPGSRNPDLYEVDAEAVINSGQTLGPEPIWPACDSTCEAERADREERWTRQRSAELLCEQSDHPEHCRAELPVTPAADGQPLV